ncbi:MAG: hypothetical protein KH366_04960 [Clostridiaceae bacterium]|nr:hypothetical protein [Clostridiaceae bacterium]
MDYANMKSLLEDPDVQKLLLVLGVFERRNESKNLTELCEHLDKISQTMEQIMLEVSNMREQIQQGNEKKSLRDSLSETVGKLDAQVQVMIIRLNDIRQGIKDKSKEVVQGVLSKGISGLRQMTNFLQIKEKLVAMRGSAENALVKTEEAIIRVEQAAGQARQAAVDVKNIGRSLRGKEMAELNTEKQSVVEQAVTAPMKVHRSFIVAMIGQIDKAINSIEAFIKGESVIEKLPEEIDFSMEPKQEIVISRQEVRQPTEMIPDIDTLLDAWEQRKRIGVEVRPLLPDKAKTL